MAEQIEPEEGGTFFARDAEQRRENWSLQAERPRSGGESGDGLDESGLPVIPAPPQRPFGLRNLVQEPRADANQGEPKPRRRGQEEPARAEAATAPAHGSTPVQGDSSASSGSATEHRSDLTDTAQEAPGSQAGSEHGGGQGEAFARHQDSWPQQEGHERAAPGLSAVTSAQSGSAVLDHHAGSDADAGSTQSQSALDSAVPDEVTNVEVQESADTGSMGAASAVTGQAMRVANMQEEYRSPGARGYHGGEGLFGDRRAEELAQDHKSVLARWARWLREQPELFPARRLAPDGEPKYLLARHVDSEGGERTFAYSNLGPGVLAKQLPARAMPGWEDADDPFVHVALMGGEDLVLGARRHFEQQRDLFAARGVDYALAGMATTYPATEYARRAIQDCNNHLTGTRSAEAPFLVQAAGPLVEPEGGSIHPLRQCERDLHNKITELLAGPWAQKTRTVALSWVAEIVEGSGAQNQEGFAQVGQQARSAGAVSREAYTAALGEGEQIAATAWRNLAQAKGTPEATRGPIHFRGYLTYHRALIGLSALERWGQAQLAQDPGFVHDLAYLALRAREEEGDRELAARMAAQLPDPSQSYWKTP